MSVDPTTGEPMMEGDPEEERRRREEEDLLRQEQERSLDET
jgi:hypothetical protein